MLDGTVHPNERSIPEAGKKPIRVNCFKVMNNSVFGKTMENFRKRVNIKIVRSNERKKIHKLIVSPLYAGCRRFSDDLAGFRMQKEIVKLDKPLYSGMTILDNSKNTYDDFTTTCLRSSTGQSVSSFIRTQTTFF